MRIAHISDLHLSVRHHRRNIRNARRLLEYLRTSGVDHLVVTGDITADAQPQELELARSLLASFGFLDPRKLSVVPGNHDIYGGVHEAEEILTFPRRVRETDYDRKLEALHEVLPEAFEGVTTAGGGMYPFAKGVGETVLVGLNSIARSSRVKNAFGSNGHVGRRQKEGVGSLLSRPELCGRRRIVLIHHHFCRLTPSSTGAVQSVWGAIERHTMKLRGKRELIDLFLQHDVALVLHGHMHVMGEYVRGGVRFLNAGGSLLGPEREGLFVQMVDVGPDGCSVRMHGIPSPPVRVPVSLVHSPVVPRRLAVSHRAA